MKFFFDSLSIDFSHPGDRRRFYGFAKKFNIDISNEKNKAKVIILTQLSDLSKWARFKKDNRKIIFDLADAYLLEKRSIRRMLRGSVKFLLGKNKYLNLSYLNLIKKICSMSDAIICSTREQKESLLPFCKNVHIILDLQDSEVLKTKQSHERTGKKVKIIWEGMANNLKLFNDIVGVLKNFNKKNSFELHLITDLQYQIGLGNFYRLKTKNVIKKIFKESDNIILHEWNDKLLNNIAMECDFAIIPSSKKFDDMFVNKSANKLFFFWKMGLPVLTSYSHSYHNAMINTDLDFVCRDNEDWNKNLLSFSNNINLRKENALKGKQFCDENYTDINILEDWINLFKSIDINITK